MTHLGVLLLLLILGGCAPEDTAPEKDKVIADILQAHPEWFAPVLQDPAKYRLQILYTQIDRDAQNRPQFRSYRYRVNTNDYFYPASTVKFPAALLALEKLNRLNIPGLDMNTPLRIDSAFAGQTTVIADTSAANGLPSIGHYIKKIFLVSDNDAFNRLFEFLGQQYFNQTLWEKGYRDTRIIRRLESGMDAEGNRATNPFTFYEGEKIIYQQPLVQNPQAYRIDMPGVRQGKGFMRGGELVEKPMDFSHSNYFPLTDQQAMLRALMFPETVPEAQRFDLREEDYRFLYRYMSMLPRESDEPAYPDTATYYDSYVKFLMFGDRHDPIPGNIRIFNKVGNAYGYLIDNAYVVDFENGVEFFLSAVIQVNENQIYNDDTYEYDEIGYPFLANLGRAFYEYERQRPRARRPDLSRFRFN